MSPEVLCVEDPSPAADPEGRMGALHTELTRLQEEDRQLSGRQAGVLGELAQLARNRDLASARARMARESLEVSGRALQGASARAAEAALAGARATASLTRRLQVLERHGPGLWLLGLAQAPRPLSARVALQAVADRARLDVQAAAHSHAARHRAQAASQDLVALRVTTETRRREALAAGERAHEALTRQQGRLEEVRTRRRLVGQASQELARAMDEMNAYLSGRRGLPPSGPDPRLLKGTLRWPARGPVRIPYGPRRHPRFGTLLPHQGLDIGAARGLEVVAVLPGKVIFSGWFEGYGRTVIMNHGGHLVSVSAHLEQIRVDTGEQLLAGQILGTVGDSGSLSGPGLYFELREDGVAVPPRSWLALRPQEN